jgi:penicillin G amidase
LSLVIAGGLTYLLNRPLGVLPALGPFFSPFTGFWQNADAPLKLPPADMKLAGLKGEVTVRYDDNGVPHVFADNDEDLYFAQGYIIARDRLWQMDFYSRVAAGRLSEVMGPLALDFDRYNRRLQLPEGAERLAEAFLHDPVSKMIAESYSAGVNAYIEQVTYKDLPIEYKILGYQPEAWSPLKTALVEMVMRKDMNARSDDYRMSNALAKHGKEVINDLFPDYPIEESPIVPTGTKWDFTPVAVPKVPEMMKLPLLQVSTWKPKIRGLVLITGPFMDLAPLQVCHFWPTTRIWDFHCLPFGTKCNWFLPLSTSMAYVCPVGRALALVSIKTLLGE